MRQFGFQKPGSEGEVIVHGCTFDAGVGAGASHRIFMGP